MSTQLRTGPKGGHLLVLLLTASELVSPCHGKVANQWPINQWDAFFAYVVVFLWAVVQCVLHARLKVLGKWQVYGIWITAQYMQWWIYIGLCWFLAGLVLAATGRIWSNMLAAVSAKTIAFLVLETIPPPPQNMADCLDLIYKSRWVKWGYYYPENNGGGDVEQGNQQVWVKFVQVYIRDGKHRRLRKDLEARNFQTGAWEGINETTAGNQDGQPLRRVNSLKPNNPGRNLDQDTLRQLYGETSSDRQDDGMTHVRGCIFSGRDFRIAASLTQRNWLDIFHNECDGDWLHLVARQLQNFVPTEVLNVPLQANDTFLASNIYGRLRRRGLLPQGNYTPSLKDIKLFEAALYESSLQQNQMQAIEDIINIIYESDTFENAATSIFAYICAI